MNRSTIFIPVVMFLALAVMLSSIGNAQISSKYSDGGIGTVSAVGTCAQVGTCAVVSTVNSVTSITDVAHITAGHISTDEMGTGMVGSESISVVTGSAVKIGTLTTGTKQIEVIPSVAINYGPSGIVTGTGYMTLAANSRTVWNVATTTPAIYFIGQTTTGTVNVVHVK